MIDYDLQKKPAFYAVQTLMQTLGDSVYTGPVAGAELPILAYRYRHLNSDAKTVIMWDGTQDRIAKFKTKAKEVTMTKLLGESLTLIPDKKGIITAPYGPSPVYLTATEDLEYIGSDLAQSSTASQWSVRPSVDKIIVGAGQQEVLIPFQLEGKFNGKEDVRVIVSNAQSNIILDHDMTVSENTNPLQVKLNLSKLQSPLQQLKVQVVQQNNGLSTSKEYTLFLRKLQEHKDSNRPQLVKFPGLADAVYILSNDQLSVTIDAARGGRVLEIIDHATLTNQIRLDYAVLPNLPSVPFAYGIWSTLNGKLKDSPMKVVQATAQELMLQGEAEGMLLTQRWRLNGSTLENDMHIENKGSTAQDIKIQIHPEYQVGGTGDSVTDVFFFPLNQHVERLPFWTGLGDKKCSELSDNWWAVLDTTSGLGMEQKFNQQDWSAPRIWFGQGYYNVELRTRSGLKLAPKETWKTKITWTFENGQKESSYTSR